MITTQKDKQDDQNDHNSETGDCMNTVLYRPTKGNILLYSFVIRTIQHWNQLPAEVLGILPCKQITYKNRVRKAIIERN